MIFLDALSINNKEMTYSPTEMSLLQQIKLYHISNPLCFSKMQTHENYTKESPSIFDLGLLLKNQSLFSTSYS